MNISIIGCGSWGVSLGEVLATNGNDVLIYDNNESVVNLLNTKHESFVLNGAFVNKRVKATLNLEDVLNFSEVLVLAVPTKVLRDTLKLISKFDNKNRLFVNASKGLEPDTFKRVSEIVQEEIKDYKGYVQLTGPSHAEEVILHEPTLICSAGTSEKHNKYIQKLFSNQSFFRVYTNLDLIGCELGGAFKNIYALASGVLTGLGYGDNAKAALISRGLVEMERLIVRMGGKRETVYGLSGVGDLMVTCFSPHSRNYQTGVKLAKTNDLNKVLSEMTMVVEGARTVKAAYNAKNFYKIEAPIIDSIYEVIYNKVSPKEAIKKLLMRELKHE